jgi:PAS domain S-box-containing protein
MVVTANAIQVSDYNVESPGEGAASQSDVTVADLGVGVLFDRLLDVVVIARLSTGQIVAWNHAAEKLFGYTADEAIGKPIEILMPEPVSHIHRAGLDRYQRTGHGLIVDAESPVEMPARTSAGDDIRIELTLSELRSPTGERFALAVIRDAMHRKRLELTRLELTQARIARSEAETALAARDELLDAVSASLNSAPAPDELHRLVRSLADLRSFRLGELRGRSVDIDLVDVVYAAADARRLATGRRLAVHVPPSAPVSCDPVLFTHVVDQVLDELLSRTEDRGRIELRVEVETPQLVRLSLCADEPYPDQPRIPSVGLLVSRVLMQHQGGTLHIEPPARGSLEVLLTVPGSPRRQPIRRAQPVASPRCCR